MSKLRLDLKAIESSLRSVQHDFTRINRSLKCHREQMSDEVLANMMAGYEFVDLAIGDRLDLFALGNLKYLLELNKLVLCGMDSQKREEFTEHTDATEAHFYSHTEGGIGAIVEWYTGHRHESPWKQAAGVYIRILSEPQLYIEGNHRCGALIMSYLLVRQGKPPFVLTVDNAKAYFDPSTLIKETKKTTLTLLFKLPKLKKYFAEFLETQANGGFLL